MASQFERGVIQRNPGLTPGPVGVEHPEAAPDMNVDVMEDSGSIASIDLKKFGLEVNTPGSNRGDEMYGKQGVRIDKGGK